MRRKMKLAAGAAIVAAALSGMHATAGGHLAVYADFPVTLKGYTGDKTNSVAYTGQIARYVLHDSLKKLASKSDGSNNAEVLAEMQAYYSGKDAGRAIIAPAGKDGFAVKQAGVDDISKGKDLQGKTYKGLVPGWPGQLTGPEVINFMIEKAASVPGGYDEINGFDYGQLISKTLIGAVFYNQAVDNYLDELMGPDKKPNDAPYKEGAHYTGKEHAWDEAFGYFGAPAHTTGLDAETVYNIAKMKSAAFTPADANADGVIDLKSEMTFANAYYAADADKSGKTNYLQDIMANFLAGRKLISEAGGEALDGGQRAVLMAYAADIKSDWEKVLAEAVYKYAGSVYLDAQELKTAVDETGDIPKIMRKYAKHWGELKGFSLALQMGGKDMGATAVKMNRLIGFSPVVLLDEQVVRVDQNGDYVREQGNGLTEYMLHMAKLQHLLDDTFGLTAKKNAIEGDLQALSDKLGNKDNAEND